MICEKCREAADELCDDGLCIECAEAKAVEPEAISYEMAVVGLNMAVQYGFVEDVFGASSILAVLFRLPKERTLEDLLKIRAL